MPLLKLRPETMPDDFLAGVEIDGAGAADSVGTAESADSVGDALETATGASWAGTEGITPPRPVSELKPKKAVTTRIKDRATLEDFAASSAAFL